MIDHAFTTSGVEKGDRAILDAYLMSAYGDRIELPPATDGSLAALIAPATLLRDGDTQTLVIDDLGPAPTSPPMLAPSQSVYRHVSAPMSGDGTTNLSLLPPIDTFAYSVSAAAGSDLSVSWDVEPIDGFDYAQFTIQSGRSILDAYATSEWLRDHGNVLTFDTSAAGYDPSWTFDTTQGEGCFTVGLAPDDADSFSQVCNPFPPL